MHQTLLVVHSIFRWLVLASLLMAVFSAFSGKIKGSVFTKRHNALRHWTATIAHIQLMIGIVLYSKSPLVSFYFGSDNHEVPDQPFFFSIIHITLMFTAVVVITIGSALAKRKTTDYEKFTTILTWFSISLLLIFIAIPWPFSPLAQRPYLTTF